MGEHYKILTSDKKSDMEQKVEALWGEGYRPSGGATFSRSQPSITTTGMWVQAVVKKEPETQGSSYVSGTVIDTSQDEQ